MEGFYIYTGHLHNLRTIHECKWIAVIVSLRIKKSRAEIDPAKVNIFSSKNL